LTPGLYPQAVRVKSTTKAGSSIPREGKIARFRSHKGDRPHNNVIIGLRSPFVIYNLFIPPFVQTKGGAQNCRADELCLELPSTHLCSCSEEQATALNTSPCGRPQSLIVASSGESSNARTDTVGDCPLSVGVDASIGKVKLNLEMSLSVPSQEIFNV